MPSLIQLLILAPFCYCSYIVAQRLFLGKSADSSKCCENTTPP
jgi:hypothetical protein